jgi:uncharacterized protein YkwD
MSAFRQVDAVLWETAFWECARYGPPPSGADRIRFGGNDLAIAHRFTLPRAALACAVATLAVLLLPMPRPANAAARLDRVERKIIRKFNRIRAAHGLTRLHGNRALSRSADYHSRDMLAANFFAHPSSNGDSMSKRVSEFLPARWQGEVLAYLPSGSAAGQARKVVSMWMHSPPHRASLLMPQFRRVGVARRAGVLGGAQVTVFTADFASAS